MNFNNNAINSIWVPEKLSRQSYKNSDDDKLTIFQYVKNQWPTMNVQFNYSNGGHTGMMIDLDLLYGIDCITDISQEENLYDLEEDYKISLINFIKIYIECIFDYIKNDNNIVVNNTKSTIPVIVMLREYATEESEDDKLDAPRYFKYGAHIYINNLFVSYSTKEKISNNFMKKYRSVIEPYFYELENLNPIEQVLDFQPFKCSASYPLTYNKLKGKNYPTVNNLYFINIDEDKNIIMYEEILTKKLKDVEQLYLEKGLLASFNGVGYKTAREETLESLFIQFDKNLLKFISPFAFSNSVEIYMAENNENYKEIKIYEPINSESKISSTLINQLLSKFDRAIYDKIEVDINDHFQRLLFYKAAILKQISLKLLFRKDLTQKEEIDDLLKRAARFAHIFRSKPGLESATSEKSKTEDHIYENMIDIYENDEIYNIKSIISKSIEEKKLDKSYSYLHQIKIIYEKYNSDKYFKDDSLTEYIYKELTHMERGKFFRSINGHINLCIDVLKKFCFKDNVIAFNNHEEYYVFNQTNEDEYKWDPYTLEELKNKIMLPFIHKLKEVCIDLLNKGRMYLPFDIVSDNDSLESDEFQENPLKVIENTISYLNKNLLMSPSNISLIRGALTSNENTSFTYNDKDIYKNVRGVYNGLLKFDEKTCDFVLMRSEECKNYFITKSTYAVFDQDIYNTYKDLGYKEYIKNDKNANFMYKFIYDIIVPMKNILNEEADEIMEYRIFKIMDNMFNFNPQNLKVVISYGTGSDGKTTLSQSIQNMLGGSICTIQSEEDEDIPTRLYTKPAMKGYTGSLKSSNLLYGQGSPESHNSGSMLEAKGLLYCVMAEPEDKPILSSSVKLMAAGTPANFRACKSPEVITLVNTAIVELQTNQLPKIDKQDVGTRRRMEIHTYPNKFVSKEIHERYKNSRRLADTELEFKLKNIEYIDSCFMLYCLVYRKVKQELMRRGLKYMITPSIYIESTETYFNGSDKTYRFRSDKVIYDSEHYDDIFTPVAFLTEQVNSFNSQEYRLTGNEILEAMDNIYIGCVWRYDEETKDFIQIDSNNITNAYRKYQRNMYVRGIYIMDNSTSIEGYKLDMKTKFKNDHGISINTILGREEQFDDNLDL